MARPSSGSLIGWILLAVGGTAGAAASLFEWARFELPTGGDSIGIILLAYNDHINGHELPVGLFATSVGVATATLAVLGLTNFFSSGRRAAIAGLILGLGLFLAGALVVLRLDGASHALVLREADEAGARSTIRLDLGGSDWRWGYSRSATHFVPLIGGLVALVGGAVLFRRSSGDTSRS